MAPHSSTLAWKIPWMEEPGRLQSTESLRVGHDWTTSLACVGEGNGNSLQCSCLENPRDKGAWGAAVYGVTQSWTRLKRLSSNSNSRWELTVVMAQYTCVSLIMYEKDPLLRLWVGQVGSGGRKTEQSWLYGFPRGLTAHPCRATQFHYEEIKGRFSPFIFLNRFVYTYFWLCWIFIAARAFSSCGGCSLVAVWALLTAVVSLVAEHRLRSCSLAAPWHVESSQTRDQICVPCIGGRFFTTEPPGKLWFSYFKRKIC